MSFYAAAMDDDPEDEQPGDVPFPVWDAVVDLPEHDPAMCGWMGQRDALVAVSRVRGASPDDPDVPFGEPGVAVWSFAPGSVVDDPYWPASHAVLGLARPFAARNGVSLRQGVEELMGLVGLGPHHGRLDWTDVDLVMDGRHAVGSRLLIDGVGSVVSSVRSPYAFAAACFAVPPVVEFRSWAPAAL
jgi:hypothetical protein